MGAIRLSKKNKISRIKCEKPIKVPKFMKFSQSQRNIWLRCPIFNVTLINKELSMLSQYFVNQNRKV